MLKAITNLEALGLSSTEAQVYIAVLQNPNVNGSQLTKQMDIPKPSVYLALDKLYQKGLVNLIPSKSKQYIAQDISTALEKLRYEFNQNLDSALQQLQNLQPNKLQAEFIHIDGYDNYLAKIKQMIASSKYEIYIHSNTDLNIIKNELSLAHMRGVKIIIYSFGEYHKYTFSNNIFYDKDKPLPVSAGIRVILVVDNKVGMMASGVANSLLSIYTENELQISLMSENVHNAIYWLKLYQLYPNFDYPCRLDTLAEKDIHISGYTI